MGYRVSYSMARVCGEKGAWKKVSTNMKSVGFPQEGVETKKDSTETFSERLLRSILQLKPEQQLDLVKSNKDRAPASPDQPHGEFRPGVRGRFLSL